MKFADEAQDALVAIRENGAAVSWTQQTGGTYNPLTDAPAGAPSPQPTASTASSFGIQVEIDTDFRPATAEESRESAEIWIAAVGAGFAPEAGMSLSFASKAWALLKVDPLAPDGDPILWRVFAQR